MERDVINFRVPCIHDNLRTFVSRSNEEQCEFLCKTAFCSSFWSRDFIFLTMVVVVVVCVFPPSLTPAVDSLLILGLCSHRIDAFGHFEVQLRLCFQ